MVDHAYSNWELLLKLVRGSCDDVALLFHSALISSSAKDRETSAQFLVQQQQQQQQRAEQERRARAQREAAAAAAAAAAAGQPAPAPVQPQLPAQPAPQPQQVVAPQRVQNRGARGARGAPIVQVRRVFWLLVSFPFHSALCVFSLSLLFHSFAFSFVGCSHACAWGSHCFHALLSGRVARKVFSSGAEECLGRPFVYKAHLPQYGGLFLRLLVPIPFSCVPERVPNRCTPLFFFVLCFHSARSPKVCWKK